MDGEVHDNHAASLSSATKQWIVFDIGRNIYVVIHVLFIYNLNLMFSGPVGISNVVSYGVLATVQ
jgi:hypothetical protein